MAEKAKTVTVAHEPPVTVSDDHLQVGLAKRQAFKKQTKYKDANGNPVEDFARDNRPLKPIKRRSTTPPDKLLSTGMTDRQIEIAYGSIGDNAKKKKKGRSEAEAARLVIRDRQCLRLGMKKSTYDKIEKDFHSFLDKANAKIGAAEASGREAVSIQINKKTFEKVKKGFDTVGFAGMIGELDFTEPLPPGGVGKIHDTAIVLNNRVKPGMITVKTAKQGTRPVQDEDEYQSSLMENSWILKDLEAMGVKLPAESPGEPVIPPMGETDEA